jgi:hypothetical protein
MIAWTAIWLVIVVAAPWMLSDSNRFLSGFLDHEFLGFMGLIVTITLASSANLFIELNKFEDRLDLVVFPQTKRDVKAAAFCLIGALVCSVVIAVVKPLVINGERSQATANGIALTLIIFSILILIDLTQAAFNLDPSALKDKDPPVPSA